MQNKPPAIIPFSALTKRISDAMYSISDISQGPIEAILSSVLSGASFATQTGYNVQRSFELESPTTIFTFMIIPSGGRKSTLNNLIYKPFLEFNTKNLPPDKSPIPRIHYSDCTPYSLITGLFNNSHSAIFIEDEAIKLIQDRWVNHMGTINKIYDGNNMTMDRWDNSFEIKEPRCTLNWSIQTELFDKEFKKNGFNLIKMGAFARGLFCRPHSRQGTRIIRENHKPDTKGYDSYCTRVTELLTEQIDLFTPGSEPLPPARKTLIFSPEAKKLWVSAYNSIEKRMLAGEEYENHPEYASKMADNIARIAGILHVFEGCEGLEIPEFIMNSAIHIVEWYGAEYIRIFSEPDPIDQIYHDAIELEQYLIRIMNQKKIFSIRKNNLLQYGPNSLRNVDRLDMALECLLKAGKIQIFQDQKISASGRISRTAMINLCFTQGNTFPQVPSYIPDALVPPIQTFFNRQP